MLYSQLLCSSHFFSLLHVHVWGLAVSGAFNLLILLITMLLFTDFAFTDLRNIFMAGGGCLSAVRPVEWSGLK
jgi:hypothetical protein